MVADAELAGAASNRVEKVHQQSREESDDAAVQAHHGRQDDDHRKNFNAVVSFIAVEAGIEKPGDG